MKLLVVDDSAAFRRELVASLSESERITIVGEAETAAVAIALIRRERPDVVLLDLRLAAGSGFDVLSAVKSAPHVPQFIILSNLADAYFRARCQQPHVLHFFDKSKEFGSAVEMCRRIALEETFVSSLPE